MIDGALDRLLEWARYHDPDVHLVIEIGGCDNQGTMIYSVAARRADCHEEDESFIEHAWHASYDEAMHTAGAHAPLDIAASRCIDRIHEFPAYAEMELPRVDYHTPKLDRYG